MQSAYKMKSRPSEQLTRSQVSLRRPIILRMTYSKAAELNRQLDALAALLRNLR